MLSVMRFQAEFLSDALIRVQALYLRLVDRGLIDYSEYTALSQKATEQGDATLPRGRIKEIDEMIQRVSGMNSGYVQ